MADPGVTPSAPPGPRPKQMPKRGIHKEDEVQVVASCPEDHHDRVVHICKESGMFKAFGKQGEFSDQLKSGARWFDLWKAKVCQTVLVATMHAECSVVRFFCVEGGPHCDEEFGTIPDLKKAVKDDVKKQNGREVEVVCEWMTMELFERNFGFGIHVKPDGKERKARLLGILGKDPQLAESVAVMKKHVSEEALRTCKRVVIIGETGAGKSAFCGLLEGSLQFVDGHWTSTFKLGHGGSSETNEPKLLAAQWRVRDDVLPILLLDTPGLGDSRGPQKDDEHMAEVARWVNGLGHVHAMVILLNNASRISLSLRENLQFFQRMFGKEMWDHSLMVVNRWSHGTRSQKKRQAGKLQSPKQFEEEFRQMLQQDPSGDGEDSDIGVGLSKERAEKLPFFFIDTHYDHDDEDEVKSMEHELREMKRWLRSLLEWKVGANSQSEELKDLILAVKTTGLAEPLKEALQTALNVAHRSSPPKDLTQEKLDAVEEEIRCRHQEEERERLQKLSLEHQKEGVAPLPVVRLCFVGRGRAGKTTTLRRLKGESLRDNEPSTHGLDVWAGQVEADLQADLKKTHPWKRWEESMHLTALKDRLLNLLPKGPETDALTAQNADEQPDDMLEPQGLIEPEAGSKDDKQAQSTQGLNEPEHATSVASQGPKASQPDALLESSAAAQPTQGLNKPEEHATSVASQGPKANEQPQEDISSSSGPKTRGAVVLDEDMLSKLGSQKAGIDVRLQCWDFPGQEEYALLNQLHFSERAIYLVFLDLTGRLEDEWRHLSFWLWKIARFSTEKDAWPPILLIGTKAGGHRCVTDLELQKRLEDLQSRVPRLKEQLQPHPADLGSKCTKCPWLFPVENKGKNFEAWISPLRMQLQRMALQFVSSRDLWEAENSDGSVVPRFVGLQAETFPLTWLQAHDLLTRLGAGFRARAERAHIEKVYPGAQPGSRFKIEDYLRATISDKVWLNLPPGAFIELHSQDQLDDLREEELSFDVSCDFLELKVVQRLLGGMEPKGLSLEDTEKLLDMLNKLGILMWNNEDKLRDTVVLNPRQVAVAMANLIALCFGADNFEHSKSAIEVIRKIPDSLASDLLRLRSSGIATQDLIRGVWKKDFDEASQQLFQEVLLRKDVMCGRLVQDEFLLPSCLPVAYCAEEAFRETDEVLYLDVSGLVSPNVFPALAHMIYRRINLESLSMCKKPGPPQVFRNRGDLHSDTHSVFVSLFPVSAPSDKSLLRILVRGKYQKANCALAQEVKRVLLNDILGFDPEIDVEKDPSSFFGFKGAKDKETLELERSFAREPCLNSQCNLTCSLCRLSALLQERFLPDLSLGLRSIVEATAFQRHTRPAGSFRFKSMQFPGDVDLEEYLVIDAKCKDDALPKLCSAIKEIFAALFARNSEVQVLIGGLKAGSNPRQNVPGVQKEWLKWSQKELCDGKKEICRGASATPVFMTLSKALEEGHETWTAKIDMFAKVRLFHDSEATERFFEITNVLRAGYFEGSKPIQPITKEKDSLQGIEMNLKKYSSEEPNAMKYVKRLWERSAYLAQRGFDLDWHVNMLEALRPLLSHWSAELCQIAAHVETLVKMMKSGRGEVIEHALDDLPTVRQSLRSLQSRLESEKGSEKEAAQDGLERIRDAMKYILKKPIIEPETKKPCSRGLHKAQLLLESCVETVVISKLGSFEFPVAKRLGELWQFPSDHPPIAAKLTLGKCSLKVASWNVLNRNYYKYIDADTQGLKGSQITTLHEAERRESTIVKKIEILLRKNFNILCLQECWPELLAQLKEALGGNRQFEIHCTGREDDKNQEAIIFDSKKLKTIRVQHHAAFRENSTKVVTEVHLELEKEPLRLVTTHVPGAPFGSARREFADCLAEIVNGDKLPTVLMADLNFPEKAVHPLLLDRGLEDIYFVPTPYPTNICQGSLLPKRIDSIAVINHQVAGSKLHDITAIKAKELLDGLDKVVELLQSRSAEPLTPTRYHSDKVETDAEKISRLERELHAARQRDKSLQSTIDSQNEERAREALLPHRPTDAPSGHFRRKVQASSVHRVEPEKL